MNYKRYGYARYIRTTYSPKFRCVVAFTPLFVFLALFLASFLWSSAVVRTPNPAANAAPLKTTSAPSLSIATSSTHVDLGTVTPDNDTYTGELKVYTTTDASSYRLYTSMVSSDTCLKHSSVAAQACSDIPTDKKFVPTAVGASLTTNSWGNNISGTQWRPVLVSPGETTSAATCPSTGCINDYKTFRYGVRPSLAMAPGTYSGVTAVSVVATLPNAPTISNVYNTGTTTNASGPVAGGTTIDIIGTNLDTAHKVYIDLNNNGAQDTGEACTAPDIVSATKITCTVPAGTAGGKTVRVETWGGKVSKSSGFTYTTPNYCTGPAYTTPPTGDPYDNAVMTLRHPKVGDMITADTKFYLNFPDDPNEFIEEFAGYPTYHGGDQEIFYFDTYNGFQGGHAWINDLTDGMVLVESFIAGDMVYGSYNDPFDGLLEENLKTYSYKDYSPGYGNDVFSAITGKNTSDIHEVNCSNPSIQYIWVDPWEVEYRNIEVGDNLTGKTLHMDIPDDISGIFYDPAWTFVTGNNVTIYSAFYGPSYYMIRTGGATDATLYQRYQSSVFDNLTTYTYPSDGVDRTVTSVDNTNGAYRYIRVKISDME